MSPFDTPGFFVEILSVIPLIGGISTHPCTKRAGNSHGPNIELDAVMFEILRRRIVKHWQAGIFLEDAARTAGWRAS
jgi:hypothetical protein